MEHFDGRLTIQNVLEKKPELTSEYPLGTENFGKGLSVFISTEPLVRSVILLEFLPGVVRGNHYHSHKIEYFYLIQGDLTGEYWPFEMPDQKVTCYHQPGDLIKVTPHIVHLYRSEKGALALELSPQPHNGQDFQRLGASSISKV